MIFCDEGKNRSSGFDPGGLLAFSCFAGGWDQCPDEVVLHSLIRRTVIPIPAARKTPREIKSSTPREEHPFTIH